MPQRDVVVIDYGVGNLLSVQRALEHCGGRVNVTGDPDAIERASHVVLPGVGAFANAMHELRRRELVEVVRSVAQRGRALLGICLGMQLLLEQSEEFTLTAGLGLISGRVVALPPLTTAGEPHKIPHIGWNDLVPVDEASWNGTILENVRPGESVYFVHSFTAAPVDRRDRLADTHYGGQPVASVVRRDNITGCQFHPEKSGDVGLRMLRTFLAA